MKSPIEAFLATAARVPSQPAWIHEGRTFTWREAAQVVRKVARGLISLGVKPGEAVCIMGPNRPEWVAADLGAIAAGAVPAGIYPTVTSEQATYIVKHSGARVVFAFENAAKVAGSAEHVITDWNAFLARAESVPESAVDERIAALDAKAMATLIYTSGTTGPAKAVALSHDNLLFAAERAEKLIGTNERDVQVSYLPLSHVAEQMLTVHGPALSGSSMWFADTLEKAPEVFRAARPTIFFAVPRVWEKMQGRILETVKTSPKLRQAIFGWATKSRGKLADRIVLSKIRAKLGLDRVRIAATGAALMRASTLEFFDSLGLPIIDIYAQSESTAVTTANLPDARKIGTVGRPVVGTELKIAADGEILTRGRHVFLGYYKDEAATREAIDSEGFLHTGDVGELDTDGFLRITDRKKDLLVTSGGKNVSPQNIEAQLGGIPGVAQAVVVGDARKHLAALIVPENPAKADAAVIAQGIARVNATLAPYETIKKFRLLDATFSIDGGELTPTMKLKRKAVGLKYAAQIDELFAEPRPPTVHEVR